MPISFYEATIPTYLQILGSVKALVVKAEKYCEETGTDPAEIISSRLIEDMQPFAYQVKATAEHALGAIEGLRAGNYSPETALPPQTFAGLHEKLDTAIAALQAIDPDEYNAMEGGPMQFSFRDTVIPFTAESFMLSFAQPNFYFHATTAYDLLRAKGIKIGKMDFLGALRAKRG